MGPTKKSFFLCRPISGTVEQLQVSFLDHMQWVSAFTSVQNLATIQANEGVKHGIEPLIVMYLYFGRALQTKGSENQQRTRHNFLLCGSTLYEFTFGCPNTLTDSEPIGLRWI